MKSINILKALFVKGQTKVMFRKVLSRFFDNKNTLSNNENIQWLSNNKADFAEFCKSINEDLWNEVEVDAGKVCEDAKEKLKHIPYDLGGGGASPLLYFIVRLCKPEVVVETGVASGFSTYAILDAMDKNETGHLYSSDFPYFRFPNPEQFIGIVVPDNLKSRWSLFIKGDHDNLPEINKNISKIDVFHYDSDKSYSGRIAALEVLNDKVTDQTWMIFDDIQDNSFFHDLVNNNNYKDWRIFEYEGKWVGMIYPS